MSTTPTPSLTVEFVGGPLDGFRQERALLSIDSESYLALPINLNVVAAVSGRPVGDSLPASSVAIYELGDCLFNESQPRYCYVGPATVESFKLEHWWG